jgi:predicted O-methyltransferase YrrM
MTRTLPKDDMKIDKQLALHSAKSAYAAAARNTGRALHRMGVVGERPPARDDRLRHWAYSLTRVHDSLAIAELDVPWWTYRAIDVVDAWLMAHPRPIRVFEYGSGASTLWLAKRADEVHSVEHHRGFAEHIAPTLAAAGNVDFRIVEPVSSEHPRIASAKEGHAGLDFTDYVATIEKVGGLFDLIVIDGRARQACLQASLSHLAADGMIVFDNTRRHRYQSAIAAAPLVQRRLRGLTPTLPYPDETSLLTNG